MGNPDIIDALAKHGHVVTRAEVKMGAGPIRNIGEHHIQLQLHADVLVDLPVIVTAEEQA